MCFNALEFLRSRCWYSRNPDTSADGVKYPKSRSPPKRLQSLSASTVVVSPDHLSPIPLTSAAKTPDPLSPGLSASMVATKETPENVEMDLDAPRPAAQDV